MPVVCYFRDATGKKTIKTLKRCAIMVLQTKVFQRIINKKLSLLAAILRRQKVQF